MDRLSQFAERGYYVTENAFIYYTMDIEATLKWFEDILGWYGLVVERDVDGRATYGFTSDVPQEMVTSGAMPFNGIHLWPGEPVRKTLALIRVKGIRAFHRRVREKGWDQINDIYPTFGGNEACEVTTPDGSALSFFG